MSLSTAGGGWGGWGWNMLQRLMSGMIEWLNVLCVSLDVFYPGEWFIAGVTQVSLHCKFGCKWSERRKEMSWLIVTHLGAVVSLLRKWCSTFFCHTRGNVMTAACIRPRITQGITLLERVLLLDNWQIRLLAVLIGLSEGGCRWTSPPLSCLLIYYRGFLSDCVKKKEKKRRDWFNSIQAVEQTPTVCWQADIKAFLCIISWLADKGTNPTT